MNKMACKCLNIIIATDLGFPYIDKDQLELTTEESQDEFFQNKELRQVNNLDNISKSLPSLVETREIGSWNIYYCINCRMDSHAIHKQKGASLVILHPNLLPEQDIDRLRLTENFSKAYKILIDIDRFVCDSNDIFYPSDMDAIMKGIKQNATETLKKEAARIEERVKKYTDQQYYLLDVLRERLSSEEKTLMRTVLEHFTQPSDKNNETSYKFLSKDYKEVVPAIIKKFTERQPCRALPLNMATTPKKQKTKEDQLFDDDFFYPQFDGIENKPSLDREELTEIESDTEDDTKQSSDRHQSRARSSSIKFAKSLPMDIPAFMIPKNHRAAELSDVEVEDDDSLGEEKTIDIAASIKKLAKSVHGSEIFGDLPRPRFSTQL